MKTRLWIEKSKKNIEDYNNSLTPIERAIRSSKGGIARWAKMTPEQKTEHLAKMRNARK